MILSPSGGFFLISRMCSHEVDIRVIKAWNIAASNIRLFKASGGTCGNGPHRLRTW